MPLIRVMCVGDSITMGSGVNPFRGGYRRLLNDLAPNLEMVGSNAVDPTWGYTVGHHEGYGGHTTPQIRARVLPVVDRYAPTIILLMMGTNDVSIAANETASTTAALLADYLLLAEQFLAKASVTRVLCANIAPRDVSEPKRQQTIDYNAALVEAFTNASSGITVHDICSGLGFTAPSDMAGTHPNGLGYAKMSVRWFEAIKSVGIQTARDFSHSTLGNTGTGYF